MRVALFTETYLPNVNGVVTHVKILKESLESLGHEVLVVTADKYIKHHYIKDGVLYCPGIEVKQFYGYGIAGPISRTRQKIVRIFDPDVIHIHNEFGIGLFGMWCAKKLQVPLVYTLHTMYDDYVYYISPKPLLKTTTNLSRRYIRFLGEQADTLTGPSQKSEDYFHMIGVNKPCRSIPNPVEMDVFDRTKVSQETVYALMDQYNIPRDRSVGVFVGRLGKEKNVDTALRFIAETITPPDKFHFIIIGDGPSKVELEEQVRILGIDHMVTFTGKVPRENIMPYYCMCDFYFTCSLSDTDSISILEGKSCGLPVFQLYDPVIAAHTEEGVNGWKFQDAEEFAQKIRMWRDMPAAEKAAIRHTARESVRAHDTLSLGRYMLRVYEETIQTHRKKHWQRLSGQTHYSSRIR